VKAAVLAAALLVLIAPLAACGGSPPQIVDYSPERGTIDVSTAVPIRITFDHDVDKQSVASRMLLVPATVGTVTWLGPRQLEFQHSTLLPKTTYEVVLQPGYRDVAGNAYALRHHWTFTSEGPPSVAGSTPANLDSNVDPRGVWYQSNLDQDLAFERNMKIWWGWVAKYDSIYHLGTTERAVERLWCFRLECLSMYKRQRLHSQEEQ